MSLFHSGSKAKAFAHEHSSFFNVTIYIGETITRNSSMKLNHTKLFIFDSQKSTFSYAFDF